MNEGHLPDFLWEIAHQLRRRQVPIGPGDYDALRRVLSAGFGLSSSEELRQVCVMLWAKSPEEAEIVTAVFRGSSVMDWNLSAPETAATSSVPPAVKDEAQAASVSPATGQSAAVEELRATPVADLTGSPPSTGVMDRSLVFVPQYPLTERDVAQAWRRLRRPLRAGPAVEIDVAATIDRRGRSGVATAPVLVPRRRNAARLLLLIDRNGSMTPFHGYVDHIVGAIRNIGRIDDVQAAYCHDLPGTAPERSVLTQVKDPFRPDLDPILPFIQPMSDGSVYADPGLSAPRPFGEFLDDLAPGTGTVVISDAGAARQRFDMLRLLDSIALVKALYTRTATVAWLNPVLPGRWPRSTAGLLARSVPMFPLTKEGLNGAVDVLRGRPVPMERPL
jgi:uncharacterized protein